VVLLNMSLLPVVAVVVAGVVVVAQVVTEVQ
jgi:hypothetical protein